MVLEYFEIVFVMFVVLEWNDNLVEVECICCLVVLYGLLLLIFDCEVVCC